jgi:hypothetical protein
MAKMKIVTTVVLLCILVVGSIYLSHTRWGRFVRGISTIVVENNSSTALRHIRVSLLNSDLVRINKTCDKIAPGGCWAIPVHTSDLVLDRLDYNIGDTGCSYEKGGIACPGERFVISIKSTEDVTTRYDR